MASKIFISYRRDDVKADARQLRDRLTRAFGRGAVFMDVDNLLAGQLFDRELTKALAKCDVLLAVIGPRWTELLAARERNGERDYVREEIAAALARGILVVPVLIDRAPLPAEAELPEDIRPLVRHQKHEIAHERFWRDADDLIAALKQARRADRPARFPWARTAALAAVLLTAAGGAAVYEFGWPPDLTAWTANAAQAEEDKFKRIAMLTELQKQRLEAARQETARKAKDEAESRARADAEAKRKADEQAEADAESRRKGEAKQKASAQVYTETDRGTLSTISETWPELKDLVERRISALDAERDKADAKRKADEQAKAKADEEARAKAEAERKKADVAAEEERKRNEEIRAHGASLKAPGSGKGYSREEEKRPLPKSRLTKNVYLTAPWYNRANVSVPKSCDKMCRDDESCTSYMVTSSDNDPHDGDVAQYRYWCLFYRHADLISGDFDVYVVRE